jgi:hypothetical protein
MFTCHNQNQVQNTYSNPQCTGTPTSSIEIPRQCQANYIQTCDSERIINGGFIFYTDQISNINFNVINVLSLNCFQSGTTSSKFNCDPINKIITIVTYSTIDCSGIGNISSVQYNKYYNGGFRFGSCGSLNITNTLTQPIISTRLNSSSLNYSSLFIFISIILFLFF